VGVALATKIIITLTIAIVLIVPSAPLVCPPKFDFLFFHHEENPHGHVSHHFHISLNTQKYIIKSFLISIFYKIKPKMPGQKKQAHLKVVRTEEATVVGLTEDTPPVEQKLTKPWMEKLELYFKLISVKKGKDNKIYYNLQCLLCNPANSENAEKILTGKCSTDFSRHLKVNNYSITAAAAY
jgi:hypothetical protein